MTDILFVYVTCPEAELARSIGRSLVEARLAACANIFAGAETVYRWQGQIETGAETVMIVKTTRQQFAAVSAHIRAAHPYETPCIVALPIAEGDQSYLAWIAANSAPSMMA